MLKDKVAVVTGASGGIGSAIAKSFAAQGATVAILYNGNCEKANNIKESIEQNGGKAAAYKCNVASLAECKEIAAKITADLGAVDILVNNAGITRDNLLMTMDEAEFDDVINTNLKGAFNMMKACARGFIKKKYGKIINISSISGLTGLAGQTNYSSSKAGMIGLTKAAAKELGGKNICCNAIAPGFIATEMTRDLPADDFTKAIPLKRLGTPEDVANLAVFLASNLSDYVTGEVIRIDGGLAM